MRCWRDGVRVESAKASWRAVATWLALFLGGVLLLLAATAASYWLWAVGMVALTAALVLEAPLLLDRSLPGRIFWVVVAWLAVTIGVGVPLVSLFARVGCTRDPGEYCDGAVIVGVLLSPVFGVAGAVLWAAWASGQQPGRDDADLGLSVEE